VLYICAFLICIFYFVNKLKHTAPLSVTILSECCDWHACNSDLYISYRHCHVCLSSRTTCWILMNCYMNVMPLKTTLNSYIFLKSQAISDNNLAEAPTCGVGMPQVSLLKCCFHNNHCNDSNTSNKFHSLPEFTSMINLYPANAPNPFKSVFLRTHQMGALRPFKCPAQSCIGLVL